MLLVEVEGDAEASFDSPNHETTPPARSAFDGKIKREWQRHVALDDETRATAGYVQDQTSDAAIPE